MSDIFLFNKCLKEKKKRRYTCYSTPTRYRVIRSQPSDYSDTPTTNLALKAKINIRNYF